MIDFFFAGLLECNLLVGIMNNYKCRFSSPEL